ncbi:hypothetical protein T4D_2606 [Trichinella pseudospiralis]|uniref:Uncharacterized protein n=1 Tax=Trichinella pseudospiralis TaxID=6337 RepID=A0A0V1G683_TRIPS|nr:hypothetical protein T4D_2606 [Trichinella pseudospiralis]
MFPEFTIIKKFCDKVYFIYANTTDLHVEHLSDVHFHQLHHLKNFCVIFLLKNFHALSTQIAITFDKADRITD